MPNMPANSSPRATFAPLRLASASSRSGVIGSSAAQLDRRRTAPAAPRRRRTSRWSRVASSRRLAARTKPYTSGGHAAAWR